MACTSNYYFSFHIHHDYDNKYNLRAKAYYDRGVP